MDTTPMLEWSSISGLYTTAEEADLMVPNDHQLSAFPRFGFPSTFWPGHESTTEITFTSINESSHYSSEFADNPYGDYFQHDINSYNEDGSDLIQASSYQNYLCDSNPTFITKNISSLGFSVRDVKDTYLFLNTEGDECHNHEAFSNDMEKCDGSQSQMLLVDPRNDSQLNSESAIETRNQSAGTVPARKRSRNSGEVGKNKGVKNAKLVPANENEEEEGNTSRKGQTSSSYSSGDDSHASVGSKGQPAIIQNGKARVTRGAATDPQSVYARKRREKINERLRTLQNLVPNGTKVDISTMLEEAVQYVKFLQLQIKLLSSDELWMYAPIAYNGIDMGLDFRG